MHAAPPAGDLPAVELQRYKCDCRRSDFRRYPRSSSDNNNNDANLGDYKDNMPPPPQTTAGGSTVDKSEMAHLYRVRANGSAHGCGDGQ